MEATLKRISRFCYAGSLLFFAAVILAGCKGIQATPTVVSKSLGEIYTSPVLDASYPGALDAYHQLMLGTVRLEGTDNAVTSEQARTLLVLWQSLSGRVLQSDAERVAVLAYIESQMTPAQLQAIAAMRLTRDDLLAPIRDDSQGTGFGPGRAGAGQPGASGTLPAPGGGTRPSGMSTRQAQLGRTTPQAGGTARGMSSGAITGSAQDMVLLNSLIRLLTLRAAEGAAPSQATRTPAPKALPSPTPVMYLDN